MQEGVACAGIPALIFNPAIAKQGKCLSDKQQAGQYEQQFMISNRSEHQETKSRLNRCSSRGAAFCLGVMCMCVTIEPDAENTGQGMLDFTKE
jgi:hypothetical protein